MVDLFEMWAIARRGAAVSIAVSAIFTSSAALAQTGQPARIIGPPAMNAASEGAAAHAALIGWQLSRPSQPFLAAYCVGWIAFGREQPRLPAQVEELARGLAKASDVIVGEVVGKGDAPRFPSRTYHGYSTQSVFFAVVENLRGPLQLGQGVEVTYEVLRSPFLQGPVDLRDDLIQPGRRYLLLLRRTTVSGVLNIVDPVTGWGAFSSKEFARLSAATLSGLKPGAGSARTEPRKFRRARTKSPIR